jgi:hypothetical protein
MSFLAHDRGGLCYHTSSLLEDKTISHGFTTRLGGVSRGPFASLNLRMGGTEKDEPAAVRENYRRLCGALEIDENRLTLSKQVHQDTVRQVTAQNAGSGLLTPADYTADALVTNVPGVSLLVFSADCILVLLYDPVTRSVGAVHAGWRGTALDLPAKAVGEMHRLYGAKPENIRAAIGPGIGPCCFETHDDVPDALRSAFGGGVEEFIRPVGEKWTVDLKAVNAWRLTQAGVPAVDICQTCTACHTDLYWSHRRVGDRRGLQGAVIGLKEGVV